MGHIERVGKCTMVMSSVTKFESLMTWQDLMALLRQQSTRCPFHLALFLSQYLDESPTLRTKSLHEWYHKGYDMTQSIAIL